ncbi:hypothetical protein CN119_08005 [Sinorhizobium meliloti]|nr:hypothetical protein CN119_08005 [Sinorhizobium meliloti]
MVKLAASHAVPTIKIAEILGISQKTLFKHYRRELDIGSARVEAALVMNLYRLASGSDGVAFKAIRFSLQCKFGWSPYLPPRHG